MYHSVNGHQFAKFSLSKLRLIHFQINKLAPKNETVILSNEAWGNQFELFKESRVLEKLGWSVQVVMYIRPQVEWMNSAWWQWGAWTDTSLDNWLNKNKAKAGWLNVYKQWQDVPGVNEVVVRPLPKDIVSDFFARHQCQADASMRQNTSLSAELIRFLQHHRQFRQNAHDSAVEFILGRRVNLTGTKTPWVLSGSKVKELLEDYRSSNLELLALLPDDQSRLMQQNQAWWDVDFYSDKKRDSVTVDSLDNHTLEKVSEALLEGLIRLDREHNKLLRQHDILLSDMGWLKRFFKKFLLKMVDKFS